MGNAPSSVASRRKDLHIRMIDTPPTRPVYRPPEAVHLDFDNMPFLQPPQESTPASARNSYIYPGTPLPPATSPPLMGTHDEPFGNHATMIHAHTPRMPSEGHIDHTINDLDFFGTVPIAGPELVHNDVPKRSHSSIASQLSVLSQSPNRSPSGSPRSHRYSFVERFPSGQYEFVDAGVPPPVPPHFKFPEYISPKHNSETETALAAVDALEEDIDQHYERRPLRSRSRSLSRSLTRRKSLGSESVASGKSMTTEIYTRKCSSPAQRVPESPSSLITASSCESGDSGDSVDEPESPSYDGDTSFSLEGYNEGTTRLRVVNLDKNGNYTEADSSDQVRQKHFVKSKAQLAEEEEQRIKALRKRYERYGHKYHVKEIT